MTRTLPSTGLEAAQNELLLRLGLPPSASPEDVDELHQAVSAYLAAAPSDIRGWAHAQAAALDAAYLQLTDPVGLQGSALRSPARPPAVVPGGPATPPARRDPVPAVSTVEDEVLDEGDEPDALDALPIPSAPPTAALAQDADDDDFDALYAMVTPSAHSDMGPDRGRTAQVRPAAPVAQAAATRPAKARRAPAAPPPAPGSRNPWKAALLGGLVVAAVAIIAIGGYNLGSAGSAGAINPTDPQAAVPTAPAIDQAKVSDLMARYQADPKDIAVLLDLADEFYAGEQYEVAAEWLDKVLALEPENIKALLARGAVDFNLGDLATAETTWQKVVALEPTNQEVHYDLGFLYLNQATPDWVGVQREWTKVVELDPTTSLAQTAQKHLDSLAASSMLPAASPAASGEPAASPAASTAPDGSPAASPAASAAPSAAPAASPAASTTP